MVIRLVSLLVLAFASAALGQLPVAELHTIHPPVLEAGKTTKVKVYGTNLEELKDLQFNVSGVSATKAPETSTFSVTVPKKIESDSLNIRASGYFGLSTSRPVQIVAAGTKLSSDAAGAAHHKIATAPELKREAVAYGTMDAKQTDWWRFSVKKGERILIHCRAERLISQADATLKVVDGRGYEMETSRDYVGRDPMIDFTAPTDGNYWIGVHDFFYNGGPNFIYTLQATTKPWIDAVFPPVGNAGEKQRVTLIGRNLPGGSPGEGFTIGSKPVDSLQTEVTFPNQPYLQTFARWQKPDIGLLPGFTFRHHGSNAVKLGLTKRPLLVQDIDSKQPTKVTLPVEIVGRFDSSSDVDEFRFAAKKGKTYYIESIANRIQNATDPLLILKRCDSETSQPKLKETDDLGALGAAPFPTAPATMFSVLQLIEMESIRSP